VTRADSTCRTTRRGGFALDLREETVGEVSVVEVTGRIDSTTAPTLGQRLTAKLDAPNVRVVLDLSRLELPQKRPSNDEIMESEEGQRRLGGYMLRRHADRVQATHRAGRSTILFHFDH
jgi:hypothetical protein